MTDLDLDRLEEIWGRAPRHVPAGRVPAPFAHRLTTADVDDLLSRRGLRTPFLRVARDGRTLDGSEFTLGGGVGAAIRDQVDDTALLRLFGEGHTLVLQGLHRTHPPVIDLAQALAADLGHPVQANAYVTPPSSRGFAAHYDVHDVFVLQTAGEKTWRLHRPVHPWPLRDQPWQDRAAEVAAAAAGPPDLEVTLRPGDALYVPRGWLHAATALGGVSTHLTLGVHVWNRHHLAEGLLDVAGRAVAGQEGLRAPLRAGVDVTEPRELVADVAAVREALVEALADVDAGAIAEFLAGRQRSAQRPAPVAPVATTGAAASPAGTLRVRDHLAATLESDDSGTTLRSRAGRLPLDEGEAPAVRAWLAGGESDVADLGEDLARRLLLAGVGVPGPTTRA
ncbi:cupin domain-containing protein [Janibacter corallicola]|uniref:cupin domain-containing protein n=1 Tax=Janibacter corallicola TaxID=415212 RepID=UPI001FDF7D57|nr:cupin domain-containing protein [Janibacter corallicola]